MRIFLNILAIAMLVAYTVVGINCLGTLGFDMDSPLAFFSMLPTWPFSFLVYSFILDPIGTSMSLLGIFSGIFLLFGLISVLASGDFPRPNVHFIVLR